MFRWIYLGMALLGLGGLLGLGAPPSQTEGPLTVFSSENPRATVVVVHSVFQDRETSLPIARAFARRRL